MSLGQEGRGGMSQCDSWQVCEREGSHWCTRTMAWASSKALARWAEADLECWLGLAQLSLSQHVASAKAENEPEPPKH